jgi:hypothetical protein
MRLCTDRLHVLMHSYPSNVAKIARKLRQVCQLGSRSGAIPIPSRQVRNSFPQWLDQGLREAPRVTAGYDKSGRIA